MKLFWVFWTYLANYASSPYPVEAENFIEAAKLGSLYDPYRSEDGKRMRFIIFEDGGTLVWDGPLPSVGDEVGQVIVNKDIPLTNNDAIDLMVTPAEVSNLYETETRLGDVSLPDHYVPFGRRVKWAMTVGRKGDPKRRIYLCNKVPSENDLVYRAI